MSINLPILFDKHSDTQCNASDFGLIFGGKEKPPSPESSDSGHREFSKELFKLKGGTL